MAPPPAASGVARRHDTPNLARTCVVAGGNDLVGDKENPRHASQAYIVSLLRANSVTALMASSRSGQFSHPSSKGGHQWRGEPPRRERRRTTASA